MAGVAPQGDHAQLRPAQPEGVEQLRRAVAAAVVDGDDLVGDAQLRQDRTQPGDQRGQDVFLVEHRNDDRQHDRFVPLRVPPLGHRASLRMTLSTDVRLLCDLMAAMDG
ncbi:hypothetical protein RKD40_003235 [Streptomyces ambofaciens]